MQENRCPIAVLISGSGSNLQAIIDHTQDNRIQGDICCVISNKADAYGLERAEMANIPTHVVPHNDYTTRENFDRELIKILHVYKAKLIVLAGFMRILSKVFIDKYQDRIVNIHPSLLPKYPGLDTHKRAIEAGENEHGCSVHFVTTDLDDGPIIIQAKISVKSTDNPEQLAKRVLEKEHIIYPLAVKWFCENKLVVKDKNIYFKNNLLDQPILLTKEYEQELQ